MTVYPQVLINLKVKDKSKYNGNQRIEKAVKEVKQRFQDKGRIVVRPSVPEPLIRVMVEGENEKEINETAQQICEVIRQNFA